MDYIYANIDASIIDSGDMKFKTVSATVDNNEGTPEVVVDYDYITSDLNLAFHNLRGIQGRQGETGEQGPGITNIRFNDDYTLTLTYGDGQEVTTGSIRGEKGSNGDWDPTWQVPWDQVKNFPADNFVDTETYNSEINEITDTLDLKADTSELEDYLTKEEAVTDYCTNEDLSTAIDDINNSLDSNYYTKAEVDTLVEDLRTYIDDKFDYINNRLIGIENSLNNIIGGI